MTKVIYARLTILYALGNWAIDFSSPAAYKNIIKEQKELKKNTTILITMIKSITLVKE